jgi:hypothetical protein
MHAAGGGVRGGRRGQTFVSSCRLGSELRFPAKRLCLTPAPVSWTGSLPFSGSPLAGSELSFFLRTSPDGVRASFLRSRVECRSESPPGGVRPSFLPAHVAGSGVSRDVVGSEPRRVAWVSLGVRASLSCEASVLDACPRFVDGFAAVFCVAVRASVFLGLRDGVRVCETGSGLCFLLESCGVSPFLGGCVARSGRRIGVSGSELRFAEPQSEAVCERVRASLLAGSVRVCERGQIFVAG